MKEMDHLFEIVQIFIVLRSLLIAYTLQDKVYIYHFKNEKKL